ncbi:gliding motility lipoprotein GldB [Lutimonas saemankumensis]|uniref:gliding motility lipoprotein GldB n=1 Tax=Lutimonas saemankumensis TaxID=483016 RepID=UPI001CD4287B|nr:gliding motility lipoprotein GldB [Lutimonas saemankumensis]MCA0933537.1 gliding motility lipoprotein GldB [Lutimonas saemankumensis]
MNSIKYIFVFLFMVSLISCGKKNETRIDLTGIDLNMEIIRFDEKFYSSGPENLNQLKSDFPYLFPAGNPDSVWTSKMLDEDELFLYNSGREVFGDFSEEEKTLSDLFKHVKYYFPKFKEPKVITVLSNVDYENRIIFADSLLLVSLDVYLGRDHEVYADYPGYIKQNFRKEHMVVDVAEKLAEPVLMNASTGSFISRMIQQGKKMYIMSVFLPEVSDHEIMGYERSQFEWAEISEVDIWKYYVENEMLYSNDASLTDRFISDAPFSKFFLEVDKDSPGRIGVWFGWQIVNSFMQNSDSSLKEMILMDNEELFRKSRYKPKKK